MGKIEKKIANHDHNNNFITTQEFNELKIKNVASRLAQANLATKADLVKQTDFDDKLKKV